MKNRFLILLVATMVVATILVGCSGNDTGVNNDNSTNTNTEVVIEEGTSNGMSEDAEAYFDKIRAGIAEINVNIDNLLKENPEYRLEHLVEVDSVSGLECLATFNHDFDNEEDYEILMETIWLMQYNKYYIEYIDETDNSVQFKFYGAKY